MLGLMVVQAAGPVASLQASQTVINGTPGQPTTVTLQFDSLSSAPLQNIDVACSWDHRLGTVDGFDAGPFLAVMTASSFIDFGIDAMMPEGVSLLPYQTQTVAFDIAIDEDARSAHHPDAITCTLFSNISIEISSVSVDLVVD